MTPCKFGIRHWAERASNRSTVGLPKSRYGGFFPLVIRRHGDAFL